MLDPENHVHFSDHIGRLSDNYSMYGGNNNYGVRARRTVENYANYQNWNIHSVEEAIRAETKPLEDEDDSGASTPPLWRSSSPPNSPPHRQNYYRSLSPASRTQAIARGQKELMEMVSRMPEGCYELSLKDIVEHKAMVEAKQESLSKDRSVVPENHMHRREKEKKKNAKKARMNRSGSIDNGGFLLKMVFPMSWGSRKKKKNNNLAMDNCSRDGRVSPKPLLLADGSAKVGVDDEWWKKRYPVSAESESAGFSSNSGSSKSSGSSSSRSSSRNSSRHMSGGCCSFIFIKKGKRPE